LSETNNVLTCMEFRAIYGPSRRKAVQARRPG
jgi:hypothetical protein